MAGLRVVLRDIQDKGLENMLVFVVKNVNAETADHYIAKQRGIKVQGINSFKQEMVGNQDVMHAHRVNASQFVPLLPVRAFVFDQLGFIQSTLGYASCFHLQLLA